MPINLFTYAKTAPSIRTTVSELVALGRTPATLSALVPEARASECCGILRIDGTTVKHYPFDSQHVFGQDGLTIPQRRHEHASAVYKILTTQSPHLGTHPWVVVQDAFELIHLLDATDIEVLYLALILQPTDFWRELGISNADLWRARSISPLLQEIVSHSPELQTLIPKNVGFDARYTQITIHEQRPELRPQALPKKLSMDDIFGVVVPRAITERSTISFEKYLNAVKVSPEVRESTPPSNSPDVLFDKVERKYKATHFDAVTSRPIIASCPLASDDASIVLSPGSFLRIGDVRLPLLVENLNVVETNSGGIDAVPIIRNKGTVKRNAGHTTTTIDLSLIFSSIDEVNGWTLDYHGSILEDPLTKERPILSGLLMEHGGLRPLIATFLKAPFVPVINSTLNCQYGIDAVALKGLSIETIPESPTQLRANLQLIKFDYRAYIPDATSFSALFNWPLFQKYVYNGLCTPEEYAEVLREDTEGLLAGDTVLKYRTRAPRLSSIPTIKDENGSLVRINEFLGGARFFVVTEDSLQRVKDPLDQMNVRLNEIRASIKLAEEQLSEIERADEVEPLSSYNPEGMESIYGYSGLGTEEVERQKREPTRKDLEREIFVESVRGESAEAIFKKHEKRLYKLQKDKKYAEDTLERALNPMFDPGRFSDVPHHRKHIELIEHEISIETIRLEYAKKLYDKVYAQEERIRALRELEKNILAEIKHFRPNESNLTFDHYQIAGEAVLEHVAVGMQNSFSLMQVESREQPTLQYIGAQDSVVTLVYTCNDAAMRSFHELRDHVQRMSRNYRWIDFNHTTTDISLGVEGSGTINNSGDRLAGQQLETGFLMLDQEIANLCGVESVFITDIDFKQIEDAPGWFQCAIQCLNFDRTQKKHETFNKLRARSIPQFSTLGTTKGGFAHKKASSSKELVELVESLPSENEMRELLYGIDLYPDLGMPSCATVNSWINELYLAGSSMTISTNRVSFDKAPPVFYAELYEPPFGDSDMLDAMRVDPDFYISTTATTAEMLLDTIMTQNMEYRDDSTDAIALTDDSGSGAMMLTMASHEKPGSRFVGTPNLGDSGMAAWTARDGSSQILNSLQNSEIPADQRTTHDTVLIKRQSGSDVPDPNDIDVSRKQNDKPDERYNASMSIPDGVNAGVEHKENGLFQHVSDHYQYGMQGRLLRAFPTFWAVLVDGGRITSTLLYNDNFYGWNGISAITVVKNREHPAHLCIMELSNVYGNLSNLTAQRALDESVRRHGIAEYSYWFKNVFVRHFDEADIVRREQEIAGLFLSPGTRIHVRMGYGNCPAMLPVVFNGTIVDVPGGEGAIQVIAQGDGMELLNDVQAEPNHKLGGFFHGCEPQDLLGALLAARGGRPGEVAGGAASRFKEWVSRMVYQLIPSLRPENPFGIHHFGNPFYKLGGEHYGECMQNIYRSNDRGARPGHVFKYSATDAAPIDTKYGVPQVGPLGAQSGTDGVRFWQSMCNWIGSWNLSEFLAFTETLSSDQKEFSTELFGKTVWDLCVMSAQVAPDYICQVVPWGFRSTLFYGKPYYDYCYDYDLERLRVPHLMWRCAKCKRVQTVKTVCSTCGSHSFSEQLIEPVLYGSRPEHWIEFDAIDEKTGKTQTDILKVITAARFGKLLDRAGLLFAPTTPLLALSTLNYFTSQQRYADPTANKASTNGLVQAFARARKLQGGHEYTQREIARYLASAQLRKPFQQIYGLNSVDDIITNDISASSEGVFNVVSGTFKCKHWSIFGIGLFKGKEEEDGVTLDMTLPVHADYTIFNKKATTVDTQIYVGKTDQLVAPITNRDPHGNMANNVATSILKNFMSYMYRGNLTVIGIPSIKPCDVVIIDDFMNELHGPVGVREVIHSLSIETGLTTMIEPDCLVSITDGRLLRNWTFFRSFCGQLAITRAALQDEADAEVLTKQTNLIEYGYGLDEALMMASEAQSESARGYYTDRINTARQKLDTIVQRAEYPVQPAPEIVPYLSRIFGQTAPSQEEREEAEFALELALAGYDTADISNGTPFDGIYQGKLDALRQFSRVVTDTGRAVPLYNYTREPNFSTLESYPYAAPLDTYGPSSLEIARAAFDLVYVSIRRPGKQSQEFNLEYGKQENPEGMVYEDISVEFGASGNFLNEGGPISTYLALVEEMDIDEALPLAAARRLEALEGPDMLARVLSTQNSVLLAHIQETERQLQRITQVFSQTERNAVRARLITQATHRYADELSPYKDLLQTLLQPVQYFMQTPSESPLVLGQMLLEVESGTRERPRVSDAEYSTYAGVLQQAYDLQLTIVSNRITLTRHTERLPDKLLYTAALMRLSEFYPTAIPDLVNHALRDNTFKVKQADAAIRAVIFPLIANKLVEIVLASKAIQRILIGDTTTGKRMSLRAGRFWATLLGRRSKVEYRFAQQAKAHGAKAANIALRNERRAQGKVAREAYQRLKKIIEKSNKTPAEEAAAKAAKEALEKLAKNTQTQRIADKAREVAHIERMVKDILDGNATKGVGKLQRFYKAVGGAIRDIRTTRFFLRASMTLRAIREIFKTKGVSIRTLPSAFSAVRSAASATKGAAEALRGGSSLAALLFEASNPIGWIVAIAQVVGTVIIGNLVNYTNRYLRNLHAVQLVTLTKHGAEFSAGINGHQGLVYGDQPHRLQSIFNTLSDDNPDGASGWSLLTSLIGLRMPYLHTMDESAKKALEGSENMFNGRQVGETLSKTLATYTRLGEIGAVLSDIHSTSSNEQKTPVSPLNQKPAPTPKIPARNVAAVSSGFFGERQKETNILYFQGHTAQLAGVQIPGATPESTTAGTREMEFGSRARQRILQLMTQSSWRATVHYFGPVSASVNYSAVVPEKTQSARMGTTLQEILLQEGLAIYENLTRVSLPQDYQERLVAAQATAKAARKGLWSVSYQERARWKGLGGQ